MAGRRIQSSSSSDSDSDTVRSRSPSTRRRRSRSSRRRGRTPTSRGRGRSPASRGRDRSTGTGRRRYSRSVRRTRSRSHRARSRSRQFRSRSSPSPPPNQRPAHGPGPRLPPAGPPTDPTQLFKQMKDLVLEQFQEVSQTIADQKEELEEKFTKSTVKFAQKPLEKQFEVNSNILALNHKIQKALKKKDYKKVKKLVRQQEDDLKEHEEDLLIADSSQHGWLTVSKIRDKKFLDSSLVKKIQQVDALIEKAKQKN